MTTSAYTPDSYSQMLRQWHDRKEPFQPLPADRSDDMGFAVAVQECSIATWLDEGETVSGWKIGLTTRAMQEMCGFAQPVAGTILSSRLRHSGASIRADCYGRLGLEMEVAICLSRVPAVDEPCTAEALYPLIDRVCAAFEVIDDRAADYASLDACSLVADNCWNEGVVLGQPVTVSPGELLTGRKAVLSYNGREVATGQTQDAGGDPLAVVSWLIGALRERGRELFPGQWVMTGSLVPTVFPRPGDHYAFEVAGLSKVEVTAV